MTGEAERDSGINRVLGGEREEWKADYRTHASDFFRARQVGDLFTGEQLREYAEVQGLRPPHHVNVWGAMANTVINQWLKYKLIETQPGVAKARDPKSHAHHYRVYRRMK